MNGYFGLIAVGCLILVAGLTWWAPRHFGLFGLIGAQYATVFAYFIFTALAMEAERYEYDGVLSIIGLLMQAVLLNCLLLPLGLFALRRWRCSSETSRDAN